MKIKFKESFEALGTNKTQRFWRFFLILFVTLLIVGGVTIYGFKSDAIKVSLGFGAESSK